MAFLTLGSNATFAFPIQRSYAGPLDHYTRVEYINDLFNYDTIMEANPYEGMLIYITKGSRWVGRFQKFNGSSNNIKAPEGWVVERHQETETEDRYIFTNDKHKGEIWVLTDLNKMVEPPLVTLDWSNWVETINLESGWKKLGGENLQWEQLQ